MLRMFVSTFSLLIVSVSPAVLFGQVSESKIEEIRKAELKEVPIPNPNVVEERVLKTLSPLSKLPKEATEEGIRAKLEESLGHLKTQYAKGVEKEFAMKSKQLSHAIESLELAIKQFDANEEESTNAVQAKQKELKAASEALANKANQLLAVAKAEAATIASKRSEIVAESIAKKPLEAARATAAKLELQFKARPTEMEAAKKLTLEQKKVAEQATKEHAKALLEVKLGEELARKSTQRVAEKVAGLKIRDQEIENAKEDTSLRLNAMEQRLSKMEEMLQKLLERK